MHKILTRQLRLVYGNEFSFDDLDEQLQQLLSRISTTYEDYEREKRFTDHILDVSSNELYNANYQLKMLNTTLENKVTEELKKNREKDFLIIQQARHAQMGEMLSMIAHQWRQPLSSISAVVGLLQLKVLTDGFEPKECYADLEKLSNYTQHLSKTIEDFREFFIEDKKKSNITLEEMIKESLYIVEPILMSNGIKINKEYNSNYRLQTYSNELKQVILNLIKNAQDAFENKKCEHPCITIKTSEDKEYCYLYIDDNAGGIDNTIITKIFEPYFTTKGELNGTGLGLYMSKIIIEEHCKGYISIVNIEEGASFCIKLRK